MTDQRIPAAAPTDGAATAAAPDVMAPAQPDSVSDAKTSPEADWRAALPAPLRRVAEKFPTPGDAVKSYAELERRLGRSVTLPDRDATAAEIAVFHSRLGRPDTPDGYTVRLPDGLPDHLRPGPESAPSRAAFLSAMHEAGATPGTVQAAFDWYYAAATDADAAARAARERANAKADAELRRDWGGDYERNTALARRTLKHFGDSELTASIEQAGLARHPAWLRALARIGRATREDGLLTGGETMPAADARQRIDTIMDKHFGKPSYGATEVQNELRGLYGALYGAGEPGQADS